MAYILSQTVYTYLHSARRGDLRNLTEVAKNCEKDTSHWVYGS